MYNTLSLSYETKTTTLTIIHVLITHLVRLLVLYGGRRQLSTGGVKVGGVKVEGAAAGAKERAV